MAAHGKHLVFAIPGDIQTRSGGYGYDREMTKALASLGWTVEHLRLAGGFPMPNSAELEATAAQFAALAPESLVLVDGLAFGAMPEIAHRETGRLKFVALVHHPLAMETGLPEDVADRLRESEIAALACARGIVVTSPETARILAADFGVAKDNICIAIPGTAKSDNARGSVSGQSPLILAVGSLTPRKDHVALVSALSRLVDRPWRFRIVGSDRMDVACADALRRHVDQTGLADRIEITGEMEDIAAEYDRADIFALASRYEGFGMVFAEAMARGLPIVGCRGGAVPDLVPEAAGMLVAPGDVDALSSALAKLLDDPRLRQDYAAGSRDAGLALPDWPASAAILSAYLERIQ